MTAYIVAIIDVHDATAFARYREAVPDVVAGFGGRYLIRGGHQDVVEGAWPGARTTNIAFADRATAEAFYRSEAYRRILPDRLAGAISSLIIVDGVDAP